MVKRSLPIIVVILILSVVYWANRTDSDRLISTQCYLTETQCLFSLYGENIKLDASTFPVEIEEWQRFTLQYPETITVTDMWIEGTNMFMGKTSVVLEQKKVESGVTSQQASFFLGACSEPDMRWRLLIRLQNNLTGGSETLSVMFQTELPQV